ncbi:MAG: C1 family peptidase [bacterium]|nr:C1 family peptidase [bacterium]
MKRSVFVILSLIALTSCHLQWSLKNDNKYTFTDYEAEFNKKYIDEQEHQIRKLIFQQNLERIREVNSDSTMTWKAGVNHLTDRTTPELNALTGLHRGLKFQIYKVSYERPSEEEIKELATSIDWREKGVVSDVRNQGGCGSCWAFSSVAVLESHVAIRTGKLIAMSEQQLVDCTPDPKHCGGTGGCEGATQELGFDYVHKIGGSTSRNDYKYTARDGRCKDSDYKKVATIEGYTKLATNDYNALTKSLNSGPVSISVAADRWFMYESGIFNDKKCGATINHAVVAVGYAPGYWIVRNSWGAGWGERGYIRVMREASSKDVQCAIDYHPEDGSGCDGGPSQIKVCGLCGILSDSSQPFGGKLA